ncbi:O-antigen polymerase [Nostoc sp. HK-01]|nr:O-antigen polymerase [Nostoc sp. HK-01]
MKKMWDFLEYGFTTLALMLYTGGPLTVLVSGGVNEGEVEFYEGSDNTLIKVTFLFIYFITFFLIALRWKKLVYLWQKDSYILLLIGISTASIIWSYNQSATISRSFALLGTTLFGMYLASRYTLKKQIVILSWTFGAVIFLSLIFAVALPKFGIMGGIHTGALRGIYNHKNVLGKMMVISTIIFLIRSSNKNNLLVYCGLILSILLLLLSRSSSAILNLLIIINLLLILRTWRFPYRVMIPFMIGIATLISGLVIWFNNNSEILFNAVGKDASLTGRTDLWSAVLDMIWKQPWLGYGYGAFWFSPDTAESVWYSVGWKAPNAHNGILDLWLNIGLIGIIIFILSFLKTLSKSFIWLRYSKISEGFLPLIFIIYMILSNLTESALMLQNDIFWILYVSIAYSVLLPVQDLNLNRN